MYRVFDDNRFAIGGGKVAMPNAQTTKTESVLVLCLGGTDLHQYDDSLG